MDTELTKKVSATLDELVDEETKRKFGELNIVTGVDESPPGAVRIRFRSLSPYSPIAVEVGREIRKSAMAVQGVKSVQVESTGHMMDELVDRLVNGETKLQTAK